MQFREIIVKLKEPFPPHLHQERKLPGGGRWFFIPWQSIRERLDEVYPEWECFWGEPIYLGQNCIIQCTIKIAGISRSAPGNAPIELISSSGKDMSRGTPVERATADAFKNAAEAWGIGRYLDDQDFTVKHMRSVGDGRAYKFAIENRQITAGARGETIKPQTKVKPNPGHKSLIKQIRTITNHTSAWIYAKCKERGGTEPSDTKDIWGIIYEMCAEFAVKNGHADSIPHASNSISSAIAIAQAAGQDLTQATVSWLHKHK